MYKVIKHFTDLQDNGYSYSVGDQFPHVGLNVSKERLSELLSSNNKQKTPLIEEIIAESTSEEKPSKRRKSS